MWVRIDEVAFTADQVDAVTRHVRNTAITRHDGDGFRGFRLLVDGPSGRALDVSYWESQDAAIAGAADHSANPAGAARLSTVRSNVYEMLIDAV
jgi:heme-degrading monooxygenase HmoA